LALDDVAIAISAACLHLSPRHATTATQCHADTNPAAPAGKPCFDVLLQLPPSVLDQCLAKLARRHWVELDAHARGPECRVQLVAGQQEVLQRYKAKALEQMRAETAKLEAKLGAQVRGSEGELYASRGCSSV
jgi:hypothetical protein